MMTPEQDSRIIVLLEYIAHALDEMAVHLYKLDRNSELILERPRSTSVNISAWSRVQLERLAEVMMEEFFKLWKQWKAKP